MEPSSYKEIFLILANEIGLETAINLIQEVRNENLARLDQFRSGNPIPEGSILTKSGILSTQDEFSGPSFKAQVYEVPMNSKPVVAPINRDEIPMKGRQSPYQNSRAKLSPEMLLEAKRMDAEGFNFAQISRKLGVGRSCISRFLRGASYKNVP
jgi:hypothetical protein